MGKLIAKIIGCGLVILLVVAAVGLIYKYTNGFNEDFKTFYVEYDGKQILTADSKLSLKYSKTHTFNVKYTFDTEKSEPKDYKVKIIPNVERDFDYIVNGEKYLYSKAGELTSAFGLKKEQSQFSITIPDEFNLQKVLRAVNGGKSTIVPEEAEKNNPYPYRLVVSSYNEKVIFNIDFAIIPPDVTDIIVDPDEIIFGGGEQNTEPEKPSYNLSWQVAGNEDNLIIVDVLCPERAVAGETVNFSVSLLSDYKCNINSAELFVGGVHYGYAKKSDYNSFTAADVTAFSFTMPEGNVEIVITLEKVETQDYHSISYDTLGSGSYDSIYVYCAEVAKAGEDVMVSIYLAMGVYDLEITRVVLTNSETGDEICELERFNEFYEFTMPDYDVVIIIYLMSI